MQVRSYVAYVLVTLPSSGTEISIDSGWWRHTAYLWPNFLGRVGLKIIVETR